jgi:hypothetical protein
MEEVRGSDIARFPDAPSLQDGRVAWSSEVRNVVDRVEVCVRGGVRLEGNVGTKSRISVIHPGQLHLDEVDASKSKECNTRMVLDAFYYPIKLVLILPAANGSRLWSRWLTGLRYFENEQAQVNCILYLKEQNSAARSLGQKAIRKRLTCFNLKWLWTRFLHEVARRYQSLTATMVAMDARDNADCGVLHPQLGVALEFGQEGKMSGPWGSPVEF